jgi:hypothetical protein
MDIIFKKTLADIWGGPNTAFFPIFITYDLAFKKNIKTIKISANIKNINSVYKEIIKPAKLKMELTPI